MNHTITLPAPLIPMDAAGLSLQRVGGKALNLAKLALNGYPIPQGFFIPTPSYTNFVRENHLNATIDAILEDMDPASPESLSQASQVIRDAFKSGTVSAGLTSALKMGWRWLEKEPVAVRSSATAEDLPDLSFAGQQDTFLNVVDDEGILKAVVDCWSSLWTARAIGYRVRNKVPHQGIALCVIVQKMIDSQASGVMFTANPLTGRRSEVIIDATLGLGEALVSGQVEPDHYLIIRKRPQSKGEAESSSAEDEIDLEIKRLTIGEKSLMITGKAKGGVTSKEIKGSKRQALPEDVILRLARLGVKINDMYGHPQDIEWAWTKEKRLGEQQAGSLHILQSRPITSLFPLPAELKPEPPRFLVGFHTIQGILEPITPLGQDTMKLVLTGAGKIFKLNVTLEKQTGFYSAAERLWINFTPLLGTEIGHKVFPKVIKAIDPGVAEAVNQIAKDPRFSSHRKLPHPRTIRQLIRFLLPLLGRVIHVLRRPDQARKVVLSTFDNLIQETQERQKPTGDLWVDFRQRLDLLLEANDLFPDIVIPKGIPPIVAGMAPFFGILERFSLQASRNSGDPRFNTIHMEIARGLPHNVTTEMDLSLWQTSQQILKDQKTAALFERMDPEYLSQAYLNHELPVNAQREIEHFLDQYGARGPGEIDIGRERWREDPKPVMSAIKSYLKITDPARAPDVVFERGLKAAREASETLIAAVSQLPLGGIKAPLVRFAIQRYRALAGMREAPKFFAIRMMGIIRQGLLKSGRDFAAIGLLDRSDDLFFLHLKELQELVASREIPPGTRDLILHRRSQRDREMQRGQIPRVILSDGTAFYEGVSETGSLGAAPTGNEIIGDPVSPGTVEGKVRVVYNPNQAGLEPGEILVCPGTDPAWTPLFLAAGGLVMEVGGMMTHGSVVAREYGIPAVVGVHQATSRLQTGQHIRLNGSTGIITPLET